MLVLSRKNLQEIVVGDNVIITVLQIKGNTVRLGISAPDDVRIRRGELEPADSTRRLGISLADEEGPIPDKVQEQIIPIRRQDLNSATAESQDNSRTGPLNRIRQMLVTFRNDESADS